jgi:uncharacterized protein YecT (DUF1311 family)
MNKNKFLLVVAIVIILLIAALGSVFLLKKKASTPALVSSSNAAKIKTANPVSPLTVSEDVNKEYVFYCSELNDYLKKLTGFCAKDTDKAVSTNDATDQSNASQKFRASVRYATELIAADMELNDEYKQALANFDMVIKAYATLDVRPDSDSAIYLKTLNKIRPMFVASEVSWINSRDADCRISVGVEPPETWGTMDLGYFDSLNCILASTKNRIDFIKKINKWLTPEWPGAN